MSFGRAMMVAGARMGRPPASARTGAAQAR
jgi:hypothetical protein